MLTRTRRATVGAAANLLIMFILWVLPCVPLHGQVAGATLSGTVTDASGAILPKARVSIRNAATAVVREVATDSSGFYSAPNILPGAYDVTVSDPGFSTKTETGIVLAVGALQVLNLSLKVGQVNETVEVKSDTSLVQLASSANSAEVNSVTVRELPLNGRDWTTLATLQPGISASRNQASVNSASSRGNRGFGNQLTVNGHRPTENNYRMNGISIDDYSNSSPGSPLGTNLGVDAIQEFSVLESNYSAEYGRTSGGVINAITKSGTNDFHGDAFWFLRDEKFDARNYFDPPQIPPFHRNQFGAAGGGPIRRNKTFIFAAYEGVRQDLSNTFRDTVPSQDARNGILHNSDGTTTTINVDPKVAPFLPLWPLPNAGLIAPGNTGFFVTSGASRATENYVTTRLDQKFSDRDSLAGTYLYDNTPLTTTDALVDVLQEVAVRRQMAGLEETHIFSTALVNSLRVGLNRFTGLLNQPVEALNPLSEDPSLGAIPGRFAPILTVPGLTTMQGGYGDAGLSIHAWSSGQVYDDAFLTKGVQSLKFGFAFERMRANSSAKSFQNGTFTFPSLQGFLTNTPTSVTELNPTLSSVEGIRQSLFGGYFQDDWQLRPNLMLNMGVRYEMVTLPTEAKNLFQMIPSLYGGTPVAVPTAFSTNPTTKNFEPRVGFSWDPFNNGKTAVRGGFGIYDVLPLSYTFDNLTASSYPFTVQTSATLTGQPAGSMFPTGALALLGFNSSNLSAVQVRYLQPNPPRAYAMNWNLNVQRELDANTMVMIGYVGSRSLHQPFAANDANGVPGQLTAAGYLWPQPVGTGTKIDPKVGDIKLLLWDDTASYNGLQAQVTRHMSRGIQAQVAYTWSHCIDSGTGGSYSDFFTNAVGNLPFYDSAARHGNCDFDLRQALVFSYTWALPSPRFGGAVAHHVLGGWELGGIVNATTGVPFTPLIAGDPLGQKNSQTVQFPDRLYTAGCASVVNPGNVNDYLKLNCFTPPVAPASFAALCQPAAASVAAVIPDTCMNLLGNVGRNQIFGPGLVDVDFSVMKNIVIHESIGAQLRFEFFNILNHPNFQSPIDNQTLFNQNGTTVPGSGAIDSTTTTSRQIQFGLKLMW